MAPPSRRRISSCEEGEEGEEGSIRAARAPTLGSSSPSSPLLLPRLRSMFSIVGSRSPPSPSSLVRRRRPEAQGALQLSLRTAFTLAGTLSSRRKRFLPFTRGDRGLLVLGPLNGPQSFAFQSRATRRTTLNCSAGCHVRKPSSDCSHSGSSWHAQAPLPCALGDGSMASTTASRASAQAAGRQSGSAACSLSRSCRRPPRRIVARKSSGYVALISMSSRSAAASISGSNEA
mmetsp:Transcript_61638/g.133469  ORF Transcript_61638/g.133469 Transcript_61638/m.133469 type:complete len:232 (-) Transcript_61638:1033-1728(-)